MKTEEKTLLSDYIYRGKVVTLRVDKVLLPNGKEGTREIVEHGGAVGIVPVTAQGKIILVRQFRKPLEKETIEIPAGKLDPGEVPEECALRELREETGFAAGRLDFQFSFYTTPGFSNEIIHIFIARDLYPSPEACDEDEFISLLQVSREEALHMIRNGSIMDGKTINGIYSLILEENHVSLAGGNGK